MEFRSPEVRVIAAPVTAQSPLPFRAEAAMPVAVNQPTVIGGRSVKVVTVPLSTMTCWLAARAIPDAAVMFVVLATVPLGNVAARKPAGWE